MVNPIFDTKAGSWTVRGLLRTGGAHAGAIEFKFQKPGSEEWLPGGSDIPKPMAAAVEAAKKKIRATLKGRFAAAGLAAKGKKAAAKVKAAKAKKPAAAKMPAVKAKK
mmetsp:Transcript_43310/g.119780  ORF Transcript_43310/g.119780 Transcript_43310/m.119780 type:complete len:108 (-) Transcript_43310:141-464(-)|eukprot:CAMPEP_0117539464 /NCGR_PEP_ID=MMETSP0784-20121206/42998_1 /TAXON_ID=39447 /ORGANISM="" /LENGTH=107 /DNA_ID=CAMNT_0005336091 /DNA_START=53 /DNA_END=376 /DNA_ORIENTATION=+